jgi:hypothetical protein
MNRNLRAVLRSEDENNKSLAEYVPNFEAYPWDTIRAN